MITSTSNSQVKNIINLMTKSRYRSREQAYIIEGIRIFMEAPESCIRKAYLCENSPAYEDKQVRNKLSDIEYEVVSEKVFSSISGTVTPQGIIAVMDMPGYTLTELLDSKKNLYMVLDELQDPGNLGTIMRTAEAAGVAGIIMSRGTVDIYNPKVIRSTMGTIFRVPFIYADDLKEALADMKKKGIQLIAAHLKGDKWYDEIDYREKTAFLIGNEGNGLRDEISEMADKLMKIPMEGEVESLNAAVASSVLMYEAYRQRRNI